MRLCLRYNIDRDFLNTMSFHILVTFRPVASLANAVVHYLSSRWAPKHLRCSHISTQNSQIHSHQNSHSNLQYCPQTCLHSSQPPPLNSNSSTPSPPAPSPLLLIASLAPCTAIFFCASTARSSFSAFSSSRCLDGSACCRDLSC